MLLCPLSYKGSKYKMEFLISTICGLIAFGIVMFAFVRAMKNAAKIEGWLEKKGFTMPDGLSSFFWVCIMPMMCLFTVVSIAKKFFALMNWLTE